LTFTVREKRREDLNVILRCELDLLEGNAVFIGVFLAIRQWIKRDRSRLIECDMAIEQRKSCSADRTHSDHHERASNGSELCATVGHLRVSHFRHLACHQGVGTKGRT
jgi:hypothetical protein